MNLSVAQLVLRGKTIYYGQDNELEVLDGQRFLHRRGRFRDSGLGCSAPVAARARTPPPFGGIQSHPTSPSPSSATAVGTSVGVTEKEFPITLSQTSLSPASYTFTIQNKGSLPHNLNIEGPGVDTKTSPIPSPGQSGKLTATLQKGSDELWCSVPGHKNKGMDLTIKVG